MSDLAELGIEVKTTGAEEASSALDKLASVADKATDAISNFSKSADTIKTATGGFSEGVKTATSSMTNFSLSVASFVGNLAAQTVERLTDSVKDFIKEIVEAGIQSEKSGVALAYIGAQAGWTTKQINDTKDAFAEQGIVGKQATDVILKLAAAHLSAADTAKVAKLAADLSVGSQLSEAEAADKLTRAIATGAGRGLLALNLKVNLAGAEKKVAEATGATNGVISQQTAVQTRLNAILDAAAPRMGAHAALQNTMYIASLNLKNAWTLMTEAMGEDILPLIKPAFVGVEQLVHDLTESVKDLGPGIQESFSSFLNLAPVQQIGATFKTIFGDIGDVIGDIGDKIARFTSSDAMKGFLQDIASAFSSLEPLIKDAVGFIDDLISAMIDAAGSPLAQWVGKELSLAFQNLAGAILDSKALLHDLKSAADDFVKSPLGQFIGRELLGAFKDLIKGIEDSTFQLRQFMVIAKAAWEQGKAFLDMGISGAETLKRIQKAGSDMTKGLADLDKQRAAQIAKANAPIPKLPLPKPESTLPTPKATGDGTYQVPGMGGGGRQKVDESDRMIAQAAIDELKARQKITGDLDQELKIKDEQIDLELKSKIDRLKEQEKSGKITASAVRIATALDQRAALEEKIAASLEIEDQKRKRSIDLSAGIADDLNNQAKAQSQVTSSIVRQNQLAAETLARSQDQDQAEFADKIKLKEEWEGMTKEVGDQRIAQHQATLDAQAYAENVRQQQAVINDTYQKQRDQLDITSTSLGFQQGAADSYSQQQKIAQSQLNIQFQIRETQDNQQIALAKTLVDYEQSATYQKAIADKQAIELDRHNAIVAQLGKSTDIYETISGGLENMSTAVKNHDWVKAFDSLEQALTKYQQTINNADATLGQKTGAFGGLLAGLGNITGNTALKDIGGLIAVLGKLSDLGKKATTNDPVEKLNNATDTMVTSSKNMAGGLSDATFALKGFTSALGGGIGTDKLFSGLKIPVSGLNDIFAGFNIPKATFDSINTAGISFSNLNFKMDDSISSFGRLTQTVSGSQTGTGSGGVISSIAQMGRGIASLFSGGGAAGGGAGGLGGGLGSVGGAVSGLGGLLGGGLGGVLSTVGSFLGPIGAVVGLVSSLFGGGGKSAQQRRDEENKAAQQALQGKQQQVEQQQQQQRQEQQQLELRLVQASGDQMAILNAQRQIELQNVMATDTALAKQVYDAEDQQRRYTQVHTLQLSQLQMQADLTGSSADKMALLTAQRQDELKAIDDSIKPLQNLMYAAQDSAQAVTDAQKAVADANQAVADAKQAVADAKAALTDAYNRELDALNTKLTAATDRVTKAHQDLTDAYNAEAAKLSDTISQFQGFSKSLTDFKTSLAKAQTATLSPENQYFALKAQFEDVSKKSQLGDTTALTQLPDVAEQFRQASLQYFGAAGKGYQDDFAKIEDATNKAINVANRIADNAQKKLDNLTAKVSVYLTDLNKTTLSVNDAIKNLQTANQAQAAVQAQISALTGIYNAAMGITGATLTVAQGIANLKAAQDMQINASNLLAWKADQLNQLTQVNTDVMRQFAAAVIAAVNNPANQQPAAPPAGITTGPTTPGYTSTHGDYAAYVAGNPDLLALFNAHTGMAKGRNEAEFGMYHWANFGQNESRPVRPYAFGGEFRVGGNGSTDSQMVNFRASPDETVTIRTPQQMNETSMGEQQIVKAVTNLNEKLDSLLYEAKADKTQRAAMHRELVANVNELGDSVSTGIRRSAGVKS